MTKNMAMLSTGQLVLPAYLTTSSFSGTPVGVLAFDASGNIITAAASGSGTVTSFSAGNLSPLFTTSVATPTSTPALTFSLSTATFDYDASRLTSMI